jgi:hypothetical protein
MGAVFGMQDSTKTMVKGIGAILGTIGIGSWPWWLNFFTDANEVFKFIIGGLTIVLLYYQIKKMRRRSTLMDLKEETTTT